MASYYIKYFDQNGNFRFIIQDWFRLEYARKENDYGSLYLDLPSTYRFGDFAIDGRFEVYRKVGDYPFRLELETSWFIRLIRYKIDEQGKNFLHILAYDGIYLLERRIVPYDKDTSYTTKDDYADDMMKAIMRENFGSLATDPDRDLSDYLIIDADSSQGYSVKKEFSRRKVLPVIQEIAEESTSHGTYLVFDVVRDTDMRLRFRTYVGCRGIDRGSYSNSPLIASIKNGILSYASYAEDHSEERNYIYAGGRGEGNERIKATAYNLTRINLSVWNRNEDFIDSKETEDEDTAETEAHNRLEEAKPKKVVNGHIQQVNGAVYGVHYGFGDIIKCEFENVIMDIHINSVHVTVNGNGEEEIEIYSRNLDETEY